MPNPGAEMSESRSSWYHDVWFVLFMLFIVLGPFGLPLLWRSPRFNRTAKIVLTITVAAYTVGLAVFSVKAFQHAMTQLNELGL